MTERPDAILDIIDGTNIERNLYLTTQLMELGIPVVVAVNMMDLVRKNGDQINTAELGRMLGCPVYEISALKNEGVKEVTARAIEEGRNSQSGNVSVKAATFAANVEKAIGTIANELRSSVDEKLLRWYSVKVFERDEKALESLTLTDAQKSKMESVIEACEKECDDDSESIITNERYNYIAGIVTKAVTNLQRSCSLYMRLQWVDGRYQSAPGQRILQMTSSSVNGSPASSTRSSEPSA